MRFLIFLLFVSATAFGQDLRSGYYVKTTGDTVKAKIAFKTDEQLSQKVTVTSGTDNNTRDYQPSEIKGFGFDGGNIYRTNSFVNGLNNNEATTAFVKVMFDGSNKLYGIDLKEKSYYILSYKDTSYLLYDDQTSANGEVLKAGNFRAQVFFLASSCSKPIPDLDRMRYTDRDMLQFMVDVERCKGSFSVKQLTYHRPAPKSEYILSAGGMATGSQSEIGVQLGVRTYFPSKSEKLSLNIFLSYMRNTSDKTYTLNSTTQKFSGVTGVVLLPVALQYNFTKGRIQPYVYAGVGLAYSAEDYFSYTTQKIEVDRGYGFSLLGGAGIEAKLSKSLFFRADWRYDLLMHLPVVGLSYKF